MRSWRTASVALLSFSSGLPARPRLVLHPRLDAQHRRRHPRRRPVHAGAGAVGVQGGLVAADGPLRAAVLGPTPRVDGGHAARAGRDLARVRRRRRPPGRDLGGRRARASPSRSRPPRRTSPSTPTRSRCCARRNRARRSARASRSIARRMVVSGGAAITMASHLGWPTVNVILALALPADAPAHLEGAGTRGEDPGTRQRCATPCGSRSSAFSAVTGRSRSWRSSCSTSSPTSSRRR